MANSNISPVELFRNVLNQDVFEIPIEANFIIHVPFTDNIGILEAISSISNDSIEPKKYDVLNTQQAISDFSNATKQQGLLFAQSVNLPGENVNATRVGVSDNETAGVLLPLPILKNRQPQKTLNIGLLETNYSFVDTYVRPWLIAISLYGMFARDKFSEQNMRMDTIQVVQYDRMRKIRKMFEFYNVAPVSLDNSVLDYSTSRGPSTKIINTNWIFSSYRITSFNGV